MLLSAVPRQHPELVKVIERIKTVDGIKEFYPPQVEAIEKGILDGNNLTLAIPTGAGKTLLAELAAIKVALGGKKVIYTTPLRALSNEKFDDFKNKYEPLGLRIALSIGNLDSKDIWLKNYDIIITSNEKLDSLIRHDADWFGEVGLLIIDEVHLIDSASRGPTLEVVIAKLRSRLPNAQLLALSATIANSGEIAEWLSADLVESDFRPVKLSEGVYFEGEITFKDRRSMPKPDNDPVAALSRDIVAQGGQSLVFVNTRRSAEATAERLGTSMAMDLSQAEKIRLNELSGAILDALEAPTRQCKRLAGCVLGGTAFHHAGLIRTQQRMIEEGFKSNLIKTIVATPTLAAGINLPSRRVVVKDYKRYTGYGLEPIPVLEYKQFAGRAGRIKYDKEGEAVLIAKSLSEFDALWEHYIEGETEPIYSKLGVEPILRTHVLGLVANTMLSFQALSDFFQSTFYGYQYGDTENLERMIEKVVDLLKDWKFVDRVGGVIRATNLGRRVAQLYIDPQTAHDLIEFFDRKPRDLICYLVAISDTVEMHPLQRVRRSEEDWLFEELARYEEYLELPPAEELDALMPAFKNALFFRDWMQEIAEDKLFEKYAIAPGIMRVRLTNADWLLYSCEELAKLLKLKAVRKNVAALRVRVKYGVREELLPLVQLRGIGRIRARKLWAAGIRNSNDVRRQNAKLKTILGATVAENILQELSSSDSV